MPWRVESGDGGFFVVNEESGERMNKKPHRSKKAAERQMAALYANEPQASKEHSGAMIAFYPSPMVQDALAQLGGVDAREIHLTLAYLGDANQFDSLHRKVIERLLREACSYEPPVVGVINGSGYFEPTPGSDGKYVQFAIFDAPGLLGLRERVLRALADAQVALPSDHGYFPHLTLAYADDAPALLQPEWSECSIDALHLCWGDDHVQIALQPVLPSSADGMLKERKHVAPDGFARRVVERLVGYTGEVSSDEVRVYKDRDGRHRWVAVSSTAFRDLDDEIVSIKALEDDVERSYKTGDHGPLRWWHTPGVELGVCDYRAVFGRTLIEAGTFISEKVAERIKNSKRRLQISLGFRHPINQPDSHGVFHRITVFERSVLPAGKAANDSTIFTLKEGDSNGRSKN